MVFVPEVFWLTPDAEKQKYDNHINLPDDLVYQQYLKQIMDPVLERISVGASGEGNTISSKVFRVKL